MIRQVVESELLRTTFPNLRWDRVERVGWHAFQVDESVYEAQFILRDVGVEFGPSWLVQLDPNGLQPPGSGGVVSANVLAQVTERGVSDATSPFLNREMEVIEALTNHQFELGAHLASALLVYFKTRRQVREDDVVGWSVVGERVEPGVGTLYWAFFQWQEAGRPYFAHWEVNLDTHEFRGLNLLASDIMAAGDGINAEELEAIRPRTIDEVTPNRRNRRAFQALRAIVDNERLLEAVTSLLWHKARHGVEIEYQHWNADPVEGHPGEYEVSYQYLENEFTRRIAWRVNTENDRIEPQGGLASLAHSALYYQGPTVVTDE
jgi:hypothetical protein